MSGTHFGGVTVSNHDKTGMKWDCKERQGCLIKCTITLGTFNPLNLLDTAKLYIFPYILLYTNIANLFTFHSLKDSKYL